MPWRSRWLKEKLSTPAESMIVTIWQCTKKISRAVADLLGQIRKNDEGKPPLLVVATAATEPKLQNGVVVQMALGHCAMPVAYTMPN
jgi:hypothetical protein